MENTNTPNISNVSVLRFRSSSSEEPFLVLSDPEIVGLFLQHSELIRRFNMSEARDGVLDIPTKPEEIPPIVRHMLLQGRFTENPDGTLEFRLPNGNQTFTVNKSDLNELLYKFTEFFGLWSPLVKYKLFGRYARLLPPASPELQRRINARMEQRQAKRAGFRNAITAYLQRKKNLEEKANVLNINATMGPKKDRVKAQEALNKVRKNLEVLENAWEPNNEGEAFVLGNREYRTYARFLGGSTRKRRTLKARRRSKTRSRHARS